MILFGKPKREPDRPVLRPEMTPIDWIMECVALLGLLAFVGTMVYFFPRLPGRIPSHFDAAGYPDEWDGKSSLWGLAAIAFFIYTLLTLLNLIPHRFNFPVRITPNNALRQYTMAIRLVRYLKGTLVWMFFYIQWSILRVALFNSSGMGEWFLPVTIVIFLLPLIVYAVLSLKKS
ncbi:MAG TPA: DUF1648 domain-containing protein [Bacteroidales bacterium]|nr:DUF1648 domain-containing protein [Bacteroidales bacterium]HPT08806.1 DUF1648 domain-containing protein [Bacteroidales bacterium]